MNSEETPETHSSREAAVDVAPEIAYTDGRDSKVDVINNALQGPTLRNNLLILEDIDLSGVYNSPTAIAHQDLFEIGSGSSRSTSRPIPGLPLGRCSSFFKEFPERRSLKLCVKDVKVGQEVLVINTHFTRILADQSEGFYGNQEPADSNVDARYEARFRELESEKEAKLRRELGLAAIEDNAAEPSMEAVNTVEGPDRHVPRSVSEGLVATISMDVDPTGVLNFGPSMDLRRSAPLP